MVRRYFALLVVVVLGAIGLSAAAAQAGVTLKVYGTSDITDSNLMSQVIQPGFLRKYGDTINYIAEGSGKAITDAENPANHADAIIVHSPPLEQGFLTGGYSLEPFGRSIFYNDYVIVGPTGDPAHVDPTFLHDAVGAFEAIATAGGSGTATFLTRNDNSGTNVKEEQIWGQTTNPPVVTQPALNGGGDPTRKQPGSGGTFPAWYSPTGFTQGKNLQAANTCAPPLVPSSCYTIVDRGTYSYQKSITSPWHLTIVSQLNASTARGGLSELTNPFHAYVVKTSTQQADALKLLDYLTSTGFQSGLKAFQYNGTQSFFPDAFATISASTLQTHAPANSVVPIMATLVYPPPVAKPIVGMPVTLQQSTDGVNYTNVSSTTSDANGNVSFSPTIGTQTTYYRLSMGTYDDATLSPIGTRFSPNTNNQLGPNKDGKVQVP